MGQVKIGAVLWLAFLLPFITSCSSDTGGSSELSEGEILYEVSYPDLDTDGAIVMMLPKELKFTFKDHKMKTSFKTAAGILKMEVISDADTYEMINTIEIFGDQYGVKIDSSAEFRLG
ncbi:MAG: hypothetical protein HQ500_08860 [Flavobacteriales bacterium]|nr:hypothetical protein [Flavobacteriales bacterium]